MSFTDYLSTKIKLYKLSYRQIEKKTGISRGNISRYLTGACKPSSMTIRKIALLFATQDREQEQLDDDQFNDRRFLYMIVISEMVGRND
jgi:transcriptional regulator with XRE-family HTH domain